MSDTPQAGPQPADPGRRYVTLLFADLSRSTELAGAMEAEHYAALLAALRGAYQDTMSQHGGMVVRVQGDGLLAMFGHPLTREDDGRRAVEAALDLHQRVRELRVPLPPGEALSLHTGIHAGLVLIGAGDIERGRFELLGPVPNIASRLSDAAAPHEVLVSEETLGPASRFFSTGAPRQLRVKGREAPILVYTVDARAGLAARLKGGTARGPAPFVGRRAELAQLQQQLAQAMAGHTRSAMVAGAPGMGKTRLVEQLLGQAAQQGCRVLRGYCESDLGAEPLQPFHHMLQALPGETPPRTTSGFVELFARMAETQPLLLFIDDSQWADDASKQVLAALGKLQTARLLLLQSSRAGGTEIALARSAVPLSCSINLGPLSKAEAAEAIAARLPHADPFVADEIARHAGGNPLFIEELCHSAARGDGNRRGLHGPHGRLHDGAGWLNHLVESRVQHLPPEQAELVRVAAVIGNVIPAWLLKRITGHGESSPQLQGLAEQDFLFPGERAGTLRFKHGITRDVIYDSVGLHARQRLHLRIAGALQRHSAEAAQDEALEALAYHFDAGGDSTQAAHYAELAGDKALAASALDRARAQYRAALAALDRMPLLAADARRWIAIMQRLGMVCVFDPSRSELALSERAVRLAEQYGDVGTIARTRYWHSYISYSMGDARSAIQHGELALAEAAQAGDEPLAIQIVATLGESHTAAAQYERALPLLDQAIAIKRQHRSGRRTNVGLAFSLVCRAYALGDRGEFDQAMTSFDDALDCIVGVTHQIGATTQGWRSAVLLWRGHWAEARAAAEESGRIAEATRSLSQLSIARAMAGYASWMLERTPESLQAIVEATAWLAPRESGLFRSLNHGWLAEGLSEVGRRREARQHAAAALRRSRALDLIGVAMSYRSLARDAAARQHVEAAERYVALAYKTADRRESAHERAVTQLCEAEIALQQDQAKHAAQLLETAAAAFEAMGMGWHLAQAQRLRLA